MIIGQCYMDHGAVARRRERVQPVFGPASDFHRGLTAAQVANGHIFPLNSHRKTGAKRL